tara:strand:+ start:2758 stop:2871 length:114 start_codon:yes stop_codon:yes gene_type:complete
MPSAIFKAFLSEDPIRLISIQTQFLGSGFAAVWSHEC